MKYNAFVFTEQQHVIESYRSKPELKPRINIRKILSDSSNVAKQRQTHYESRNSQQLVIKQLKLKSQVDTIISPTIHNNLN